MLILHFVLEWQAMKCYLASTFYSKRRQLRLQETKPQAHFGKQANSSNMCCHSESHKSSTQLLKAFVSDDYHGQNMSPGLARIKVNRLAWVSQLVFKNK